MTPSVAAVAEDPAVRRAWLVPFFAHTLLVQAITFVLRPTAIYRALELDVPTHWLGALGASFALVPLVLAVPTGLAADRWGERRVMLFGGLLTLAAAGCFIIVADSVRGLLAASVLLGNWSPRLGRRAAVDGGEPHAEQQLRLGLRPLHLRRIRRTGHRAGLDTALPVGRPPSPTPERSLPGRPGSALSWLPSPSSSPQPEASPGRQARPPARSAPCSPGEAWSRR